MRSDRLASVTLRQLRIFAATAREGGFARAAGSLYMTEGTVSEQIKELERRIGMRLLGRSRGKSGVEVSEAGRVLLRTCDAVFDALQCGGTALDEMHGQIVGSIVLGTGMTFGAYVLPSLCADLRRTHPGISVRVETARSARILDRLVRGDLDLAVLLGPGPEANLVSEAVGHCELLLVGPPGHRFASGPPVPFAALAEERFILDDRSVAARRFVEQMAAEARITLDVALEVTSDEVQRESVVRGLGVAVLSAPSVHDSLMAGRMCVLQVQGFPLQLEWHIVHRPAPLSPAAKAFKQHLLKHRAGVASTWELSRH